MKKRAQSEIITTVLIIVLVLAAIIIVWNVVKRTIATGTEGMGIEIFTNNLEVVDVKLGGTVAAKVAVKRGSGKGDITSLKFIFYDEDGESHIIEKTDNLPDELETKVYDFSVGEINSIKRIIKVSVVPMFGTKAGMEISEVLDIQTSCLDILNHDKSTGDGVYWIDPDGTGGSDPFQVNCDMTTDGGGWTLFLKTWYAQPAIGGNTGAVGIVSDATSRKGNSYKLADETVRQIIGPNQRFDILADQSGYNSAYSTGNYEYVVLRDYTGYWTFGSVVAPSTTTTTFQSYRISDNALAWTGNLQCGNVGSYGINCYTVLENNPQGGAGCVINMGTTSSALYHHFYMTETNTDTYLYICNGAQQSSGQDMNHRWYVRES